MKIAALAAALTASLALAACGEPVDGSDTADMTSDAVSADTGPEDTVEYDPNEDGPLQSDALVEDGEMATDAATAETGEIAEDPAM